MQDISELQGRITAALDRIGQGLESLSKTPDPEDAGEIATLRSALDEERTANAQLEERVRAIKSKQESMVDTLAEEVGRLRGLLRAEEVNAARLARVNAELRSNNGALRAAISAGVAEPHLVNKSMMAELESLRALQAADRAELDAVLGELEPLLSETGDEESADA